MCVGKLEAMHNGNDDVNIIHLWSYDQPTSYYMLEKIQNYPNNILRHTVG